MPGSAWLQLSFSPFPVRHPGADHGTYPNSTTLLVCIWPLTTNFVALFHPGNAAGVVHNFAGRKPRSEIGCGVRCRWRSTKVAAGKFCIALQNSWEMGRWPRTSPAARLASQLFQFQYRVQIVLAAWCHIQIAPYLTLLTNSRSEKSALLGIKCFISFEWVLYVL